MIDENSTDRFSWQFWPLTIRYRCGFDFHNYLFNPNTHGGWRHRSHFEVVRRCWPQRPMGDLKLSILGHYS